MSGTAQRTWSEDEYIVALDSYFRNKQLPRHVNAPHIIELANLFGRTPASLVMRMENFASLDPEESAERKGLTGISPFGRRIFAEWYSRQDHLRSCAEVSIRRISESRNLALFAPDLIGPGFEEFEILDRIGDGGFGTVFSCVHRESGKPFAIKRIKTDQLYDHESVQRFMREIRVLRSIEHRNVIRLHKDNLGPMMDRPTFVMDIAEFSLQNYLDERYNAIGSRPCIPRDDASAIFASMLDAAEALHKHTPVAIHRDINPNNILRLPNGAWVLADFSLAKFLHGHTSTAFVTRQTRGLGTAHYAAPEQYTNFKNADERADIFALGTLLWELFSQASPPPAPGDATNSGLPAPLDKVYAYATDRDRERRFGSVLALRAAFEEAVPGTAAGANAS